MYKINSERVGHMDGAVGLGAAFRVGDEGVGDEVRHCGREMLTYGIIHAFHRDSG